MIRTPPEHNTKNPPGQIVHADVPPGDPRPRGLYLRDVIKRIQRDEEPMTFRDGDSAKYARENERYDRWARAVEANIEKRYGPQDPVRYKMQNPLPTPIAGPAKALEDLKGALLRACTSVEDVERTALDRQIPSIRTSVIRRIIKENT